MKIVQKHQRYLGLQAVIGQNISEVFSWNNCLPSNAGKEILIKAVLQSLPLYAMNCFYVPDKIIRKLQQIILQFWSGGRIC